MLANEGICFGPYRLPGPQGPLHRGDTVIALQPKPLAVLWELLRHHGEVVTKERLLSAVWANRVVTEGVIAACLRDLRQALDDDPKQPRYIATVHRIGYRFVGEVGPTKGVEPAAAPVQLLVGRDSELARLLDAFARALAGQRQLVFVSGEAGIGKTALVDAFVSRLEQARAGADGLRVARGQCVEHYGGGEPYLPVLDALRRLCRQAEGFVGLLRRHAPAALLQLAGLLDEADYVALQLRVAGGSLERMQREMVEAIEAASAEAPLLLVLEDMHWSDRSTVEWLAMLARRREPARLLLIATVRPVELIVGEHPLKLVRQELVARGAAIDIALGHLSAAAVKDYVELRLAGRADRLGPAMYRRSQGHPLFMVQLADDWQRMPAAGAQTDPSVELDVPHGVRELLAAQLARLAAEQQAVLEAASVAGAEFAAATAAAGSGSTLEETERILEALVARGQFVEARGLAQWHDGTLCGRYAFVHELVRETLYRGLGAARRLRLHLRVGERLALAHGAGAGAGEAAAELALHFEHAREPARAARYQREAAETALRRHACREALAHVDKGLALLRTLPADDAQERAELLLRLTQGAALLATSGFGAADVEETYLRAHALCLRTGDREALPPVLSGLWNLYVTRADFARARCVADELFARAPPDAAPMMIAHNALGYTLLFVGELAAVPEHVEASQALYEPRLHRHLAVQYGEDPGVVCRMLATLTYWLCGDRQRSMDHLDRGHELARMLAHPLSEAQMLWVEAVVCCDDGALERLDDVAQRLIALCLDNDFPLWLAGGRILRGRALAGRGRFDEGLAEAMHGLDGWRAMGGLLLPHALAVVASIHSGNGERAAALRLLDEALHAVQRTGERWYEAELWRLHGEAMQADGSQPAQRQARASFETAIGIARRQQARLLELRATANVTRLSKQLGASAAAGR